MVRHRDSARILTGYHLEQWTTLKHTYRPQNHYVGRVKVLGFTSANTSSDGRAVLQSYLRYLAKHPATARRIASRLCRRFVSDHPSDAIVTAVAQAYLASGTDIKTTLRAWSRTATLRPVSTSSPAPLLKTGWRPTAH